VPAAYKAWVDLISRARKTFQYTENGPEGLLKGKKAYVAIASGGTASDSDMDFATPYVRRALAFIGITDVTVIAADQLMMGGEDKIVAVTAQVEALAA
jgi:FMN-dependent NADH-azoreductase